MEIAASMSNHANDESRLGTPPPSTGGRAAMTASRHEVMSASGATRAAAASLSLIAPSAPANAWKEPGPPRDRACATNVIRAVVYSGIASSCSQDDMSSKQGSSRWRSTQAPTCGESSKSA